MIRRSPKTGSAVDQQHEELARRENELRDRMQKLQQMIEEAPRLAQETSRRQREELLERAHQRGSRLDASLSLRDKRWGDEEWGGRRPGSLRQSTPGRPDHFSGAGNCAGSGGDVAADALSIFRMAGELDVAYVAQLARLNLTAEETELFQKQLGDVLKYAEKLKEANVERVEATAHAVPIFNVFRADEPCDWFTATEALSNAPRQANNLFIVTKVVE